VRAVCLQRCKETPPRPPRGYRLDKGNHGGTGEKAFIKGGTMTSGPEGEPGKDKGNSPDSIPGGEVFAYNLDDSETPGGIKVRWKIRVAQGKEAERVTARQAEAIREL
jgi:hypothetical protein